jgi:hypothetical protein
MADGCERDREKECDIELQQETEIDDPSIGILPETDAEPVEVGPPSVIQLQPARYYPNFKVLGKAAMAAMAGPADDTHVQGYVEPDDSLLNVSEYTSRQVNPLLVSYKIMDFVEQCIKSTLFKTFDQMFDELHVALSNDVPDLGGATKGFVGITRCGFLSKYTTVIYYAGRILLDKRIPFDKNTIFRLIETCYQTLVPIVGTWNTIIAPLEITNLVEFTCKVEKSQVQYDTQKIILCIKLKSSGNIIQIPILNVVGFPVYQDVNLLLQQLGCISHPQSLHCFVDQILPGQTLSLLDIIVRVRLCANQGAITALSEPSKEEVTLILNCFQGLITTLPTVISTIMRNIHDTLYNTDANIKPFALFCNIFYNFINVSLGYRSLAKIIYSEFFGASDNYGKVIRACQVVNSLPIMRKHVKFFLTGSNAARVYVALNDIIKFGTTESRQPITPENIEPILKKTFGNLSDNDFMIYLNSEVDEPYRVFIRMILGGSFYFFKDLFDPGTLARFTETMIQSVGIVGYMDHLFAQRFDARPDFLQKCYEKDTSFLANILQYMPYFHHLDKQINVAHLDGVFKYYTLEKFYKSILSICNSIPLDRTSLNIEALNAAFSLLQMAIIHITKTQAIIHDEIKSQTITLLFTKFSQFYNTKFIPQLTTEIGNLRREALVFFPTDELLISLDNLIMLLDELIKYMTKHDINYVYRENTNDKGKINSRETSIQLFQTVLVMFEQFKNSNFFNQALEFLIDKATSIDCIATVWTLVLNVLYTLFVPENCLARIAVGKFDNDPKNLKLYMGILTDHLDGLTSLKYNHPTIPELRDLQTSIATMCEEGIQKRPPLFKETCDKWVRKMVEMASSGIAGQGLFMLSVSDALNIRNPILKKNSPVLCSTNLERALCLAYLPTAQGNICSALTNPKVFIGEMLKVQTGNVLYDPDPLIEVIKRSTTIDYNEAILHRTLGWMGSQIEGCFGAIDIILIHIRPEGTPQQLSSYLNFLWKHITTSAIDLKIFFKENLTDIKRVTGIKYIALVLGGYFQIRLLVDDVREQCPDDRKRVELESFKTSQEMMACKRGLLPLLIESNLITLIKNIIETDIKNEISRAAASAVASAAASGTLLGITPQQYAVAYDNVSKGMNSQQYRIVFAAATTAIQSGIDPLQHVVTTLNITPQQYNAVAALNIHPDRYAAVFDNASKGMNPDMYATAYASAYAPAYAAAYAAAYDTASGYSYTDIITNPANVVGFCFHTVNANSPPYEAAYGAAVKAVIDGPIPRILKILGFLFSIKVKSSSPHSPYQHLRLEDSMLRFKQDFTKDQQGNLIFTFDSQGNVIIPFTTEILRPTEVMFIQFLKQLDVPDAFIKCICSSKYKNKEEVKNLDLTTLTELNPDRLFLYEAMGGSNDSESNSGRNSVSSLNKYKHKYKHNKLARNNHTRRNKNKRKKNSKSKTKTKTKTKAKSSPKYRKAIPSSRSGSQSNRKKSKTKKSQKNVTFKRRRARK